MNYDRLQTELSSLRIIFRIQRFIIEFTFNS